MDETEFDRLLVAKLEQGEPVTVADRQGRIEVDGDDYLAFGPGPTPTRHEELSAAASVLVTWLVPANLPIADYFDVVMGPGRGTDALQPLCVRCRFRHANPLAVELISGRHWKATCCGSVLGSVLAGSEAEAFDGARRSQALPPCVCSKRR